VTRVLGAALLAAGAAAVGFGAAARLEGRVRDLRGLTAGLEAMARALDARLAPLEEMLSAAAESTQGRPAGLYRACAQALGRGEGRSFRVVWNTALEELPLRLERADLDLLRPLGEVLGRYDGDSQAAALAQTVARLGGQLEEAVEQRRRLGRLYGTMGVSAGLFLAILLF